MGDYEMTNLIVEFEPHRLIQWQPIMTRASRPEDSANLGNSATLDQLAAQLDAQ